MYPPRSQKNEGRKKARKRKIGKAWIITNLVLLLMIVGLFGYYYIFEHRESSSLAENAGLLQQENKAKTDSAGGGQSSSPIRENVTAVSNEQMDDSSNGGEQADDDKTEHSSDTATDTDSRPVTTSDTNIPEGNSSESGVSSENAGQSPDSSSNKGASNSENSADPNESEQGKNVASDGTASPTVTLHFVGDVQFSGKVEQRLEKNGFDFPYQYLGNLFRKDDLTIANLETPVTTGGVGALNKTYVYKSSPKALTALAAAGIDAVNLAQQSYFGSGHRRITGYAEIFERK